MQSSSAERMEEKSRAYCTVIQATTAAWEITTKIWTGNLRVQPSVCSICTFRRITLLCHLNIWLIDLKCQELIVRSFLRIEFYLFSSKTVNHFCFRSSSLLWLQLHRSKISFSFPLLSWTRKCARFSLHQIRVSIPRGCESVSCAKWNLILLYVRRRRGRDRLTVIMCECVL